MAYRTNGQHQPTEAKGGPRFSTDGDDWSDWTEKLESTLAEAQDRLLQSSTAFIQARPGLSLVLAALAGGVIGWLLKRRG